MTENTTIEKAFQDIGQWVKEVFADQFGNRWKSGFIHCSVSSGQDLVHRFLVTYINDKSAWVTIRIDDKVRGMIKYLILTKKEEKERINSLRIHVWPERPGEFDFSTDPTIQGSFDVAPLEEPTDPLISGKDWIIGECVGFLTLMEIGSVQLATFQFHRLSVHVCVTLNVIEINGKTQSLNFTIEEELRDQVICFWEESYMSKRHILQITFDEQSLVMCSFLNSYVLETLQWMIQGTTNGIEEIQQ